MKTATTHYAKTHLSRLLKDVQRGETITILHGKVPVGKLTATEPTVAKTRPRVGTITAPNVRWEDDAFAPLGEDAMEEWGV